MCVCVCVCVCLCVTNHQSMGCVQIMRWWSSNLGQCPLRNLGSIAYCYLFILVQSCLPFLPYNVLPGGSSPFCPNTSSTDVRRVSAHDHPPTWASSISIPAYQCSMPRPYPLLSVTPPSDPLLLLPRLMDSCRRRTLAAEEIASTSTFSCFSANACLNHGTRSLPPPS